MFCILLSLCISFLPRKQRQLEQNARCLLVVFIHLKTTPKRRSVHQNLLKVQNRDGERHVKPRRAAGRLLLCVTPCSRRRAPWEGSSSWLPAASSSGCANWARARAACTQALVLCVQGAALAFSALLSVLFTD